MPRPGMNSGIWYQQCQMVERQLLYQTMSEAWALQEKLYKEVLFLQINPFSVVDSSMTGSGGARSVQLRLQHIS